MLNNDEQIIDPYLGGFNSGNAYFVQVYFSNKASLYKDRTFKEMMRDIQDMLVTGGINTNLFKSRKKQGGDYEQLTFVVNNYQ